MSKRQTVDLNVCATPSYIRHQIPKALEIYILRENYCFVLYVFYVCARCLSGFWHVTKCSKVEDVSLTRTIACIILTTCAPGHVMLYCFSSGSTLVVVFIHSLAQIDALRVHSFLPAFNHDIQLISFHVFAANYALCPSPLKSRTAFMIHT